MQTCGLFETVIATWQDNLLSNHVFFCTHSLLNRTILALIEAVTVRGPPFPRDYLARRELSQIKSIDRPDKSEPPALFDAPEQDHELASDKGCWTFCKVPIKIQNRCKEIQKGGHAGRRKREKRW
jgi:hypothetical protein